MCRVTILSRVTGNLVPWDGILLHVTDNFKRKLVDWLFLTMQCCTAPRRVSVRGPWGCAEGPPPGTGHISAVPACLDLVRGVRLYRDQPRCAVSI